MAGNEIVTQKLDKQYSKVVLKFSKILHNLKLKNNAVLCKSGSCITVNLKLNMRFPINHFSIIVRSPQCTAKWVLSCADITYFISASVAVDRLFNAASKKENNTKGMSIHFLIKYFLKKPSPLAHNTDEKNQAPKLLFVTAAVDLVLQLDLRVRKCSNFISMILSNTLL